MNHKYKTYFKFKQLFRSMQGKMRSIDQKNREIEYQPFDILIRIIITYCWSQLSTVCEKCVVLIFSSSYIIEDQLTIYLMSHT